MKNIHLHTVVINNKTLEILSADSDFYAYMGQSRFFNTFEKLIHPDAQPRFMGIISEKSTEPFVIDMAKENGDIVLTYMRIAYGDKNMTVELESLAELREGQELYSRLCNLGQELLGLHNDLIFTYDEKNSQIEFYSPDFRRCVKTCTFQEFVDDVRGNVNEEDKGKLEELIVSLKAESGSFAYTFSGKILSGLKECKNSIVKGFSVSKSDIVTAIGYIHRGSNKGEASYTVEKDPLTGTYSKREIANMARRIIEVEKRLNIAICIIDIDYFKNVNDNFGHKMGDIVLKEIAEIIRTEVGTGGLVGRFGGDEFFAVLYDVADMEQCREKLRGMKTRVSTQYPPSEDGSTVSATLSIGCAVYPKDADNYDDLFALADYCLYLAKEKGRNRYIFYNPERHDTLADIKNQFQNNRRIDARKNLAMGDVLCMIEDKHYEDPDYTPEMLVDDLVENLPIERIVCITSDTTGGVMKHRCMSGINLPSVQVINECIEVLQKNPYDDIFENDIMMVDNIERLKNIDEEIYKAYNRMNIKSFVMVRFCDAAGKKSIISLEMTTVSKTWNLNQDYNYRKIARMFAKYEL